MSQLKKLCYLNISNEIEENEKSKKSKLEIEEREEAEEKRRENKICELWLCQLMAVKIASLCGCRRLMYQLNVINVTNRRKLENIMS